MVVVKLITTSIHFEFRQNSYLTMIIEFCEFSPNSQKFNVLKEDKQQYLTFYRRMKFTGQIYYI